MGDWRGHPSAGLTWGLVRLLTRVKILDVQAAGFPPVASGRDGAGCGQQSGGEQEEHGAAASRQGQDTFIGVGQMRLGLADTAQGPVHDHISQPRIMDRRSERDRPVRILLQGVHHCLVKLDTSD